MSARTAEAKRLLKEPESKFIEQDVANMKFLPRGLTRAFSDNRYIVMILTASNFNELNFNNPVIENSLAAIGR